MKNAIIFFFILFSISAIGKAQMQDTIIKENQINKMIQDALFTVLKIEKGYIDNGIAKCKINDDFYIWIDYYPAGFELSQEILNLKLKLKFVSKYGLTQKQKEGGINGIGFSGVKIDGNQIRLYFASEEMLLFENRLLIGLNPEGYIFVYEYSCEKQEWILIQSPKQL